MEVQTNSTNTRCAGVRLSVVRPLLSATQHAPAAANGFVAEVFLEKGMFVLVQGPGGTQTTGF